MENYRYLVKSWFEKLMAQCHLDIQDASHAIAIFLEDIDSYGEIDEKTKRYIQSLKTDQSEYLKANKDRCEHEQKRDKLISKISDLENRVKELECKK